MSPAQVREMFTYHEVKPDQIARYNALRAKALEYAELIMELTPSSAEQTLAIRSLHLANMQANSAIAINE